MKLFLFKARAGSRQKNRKIRLSLMQASERARGASSFAGLHGLVVFIEGMAASNVLQVVLVGRQLLLLERFLPLALCATSLSSVIGLCCLRQLMSLAPSLPSLSLTTLSLPIDAIITPSRGKLLTCRAGPGRARTGISCCRPAASGRQLDIRVPGDGTLPPNHRMAGNQCSRCLLQVARARRHGSGMTRIIGLEI